METYKEQFALILAETGALFFDKNFVLKDGRPTPYFVNTAMFKTGCLGLMMGTFFDGCRIFVVDDVATCMGTKYEVLEKLENEARL